LCLTSDEIQALSDATVNQRDSQLWHEHHAGRITATKCHAVYTYMNSAAAQPHPSSQPSTGKLLQAILGHTKPFETLATKHGIAMEPHATVQYAKVMEAEHRKFHVGK